MDDAHETGVLTLQQWRKRFPDGRVPLEQALEVVRQLMAALHEVHIKSPFHRDIIPSTVEVVENGDGTRAFSVPDLASVAENHGEPGARRYLAPEQWWGGRQNTYTDQYALAALFAELVTGSVPFAEAFDTDDESVMRTAACKHEPKLPSDCPRRDVLLRALAKDPRARFHSCSSFAAALADPAAAREEVPVHVPTHSAESAPRHRRRSPLKVLFVLVLVGGVAVVAVRSGLLDRHLAYVGRSEDDARARRVAEARKEREAEREAGERARVAEAERLHAEVERQETAVNAAYRALREFLETGGPAALTVRRDVQQQALKRANEELVSLEEEVKSARKLEESLAGLRSGAQPFGNVSGNVPADNEVARAYAALAEESAKLDDLSSRFTEKHPNVVAQQKLFLAARKRYAGAVVSGHAQAQTARASAEKRLEAARAAAAQATEAVAKLDHELVLAKLKQDELERRRERETRLLTDLRLRENAVRFGTASAPTNVPAR